MIKLHALEAFPSPQRVHVLLLCMRVCGMWVGVKYGVPACTRGTSAPNLRKPIGVTSLFFFSVFSFCIFIFFVCAPSPPSRCKTRPNSSLVLDQTKLAAAALNNNTDNPHVFGTQPRRIEPQGRRSCSLFSSPRVSAGSMRGESG